MIAFENKSKITVMRDFSQARSSSLSGSKIIILLMIAKVKEQGHARGSILSRIFLSKQTRPD